ncbi:MAG: glycosyltransferase family 4 protein [Acidimicrobiales bacterium]
MQPRLVHVTTTDMSLDWLLRPQLEAFADAGFEVIGMSAPGPHVAALRAAGIEHVAIGSLTRSVTPLSDIRAVRQLTRALRVLRPDIVHTHNPKSGVLGRLAARVAGVPAVVNTVHGLYATPDDPLLKRAIVYGLERMASSCSDVELLQNEEDLEVMRRIGAPHAKLTVLGNGVDLRFFDRARMEPGTRERVRASLGLGPDTVAIGVVGRLVWEKGYREVFATARALEDRDCRVIVVGPDDPARDSAAVDGAARTAAERSGVLFLGGRDDMAELYSAFDLYVLASYREGFPRSAMEAAAMGLPVVATDIRGGRQVVVDGTTGLLVPPGDAGALTGAVDRLVTDLTLRARLANAARPHARRAFDQDRVIEITLRTYDWLLGRRTSERLLRAAA